MDLSTPPHLSFALPGKTNQDQGKINKNKQKKTKNNKKWK